MGIKKVKRKVDGKYKSVFVYDSYIDGKRVRTPRGKYFSTYPDCENAISALRIDSIRKEYGLTEPDKPSVTLEQLAEAWAASLKANNRNKGYTQRAERVMRILAKVTGNKLVVEVTARDLQEFAQYELKNGTLKKGKVGNKKEGTVKEHLVLVCAGLNAASLLFPELEKYRPPRKPKLGLAESARERIITPEEEGQIIAAYMTKRNRENPYYKLTREQGAKIFWFALRTAMRAGEIIGLRRSSIVFASSPKMPNGYIIVQEQRGGVRTKTGKVRKIPMTPSLVTMLKEHLDSHQSEYVFPSIINPSKPIGQFYTGFKAACKLAKVNYGREALNGLVFHDTRHTAITRFLENGVPLHTVAKIAGHSNTSMTMRYAHVSDDTKHQAMMSLDDSEFGDHSKT